MNVWGGNFDYELLSTSLSDCNDTGSGTISLLTPVFMMLVMTLFAIVSC